MKICQVFSQFAEKIDSCAPFVKNMVCGDSGEETYSAVTATIQEPRSISTGPYVEAVTAVTDDCAATYVEADVRPISPGSYGAPHAKKANVTDATPISPPGYLDKNDKNRLGSKSKNYGSCECSDGRLDNNGADERWSEEEDCARPMDGEDAVYEEEDYAGEAVDGGTAAADYDTAY